jgi:hypothetical protein
VAVTTAERGEIDQLMVVAAIDPHQSDGVGAEVGNPIAVR